MPKAGCSLGSYPGGLGIGGGGLVDDRHVRRQHHIEQAILA